MWYSLPAEEGDAARADEAAMQDVVVVGLDLRPPGPLLEPRLRTARCCTAPVPSTVDATP